ncbi:ABC transporter ATP-binding protein [Kamptonema cortianum]|nr:ABC transporter ATP-binding protein [Geitlerinema splendidum]MDK3158468.1 ABC transporter ATP-binding protein [Kamptonema cortianum]
MTPGVEMLRITQDFGPVKALDEVDFRVAPNTIHALVGENGAGKTTLVKILYGALQATDGTILLNGEQVSFSNPQAAIQSGIGMVSQHYSIIPELTALQNLMLGAEPGFVISKNAAIARATELANQMGLAFNWEEDCAQISPAQAQKLEILKLLWRNSKLMILDEPTAMLSPADSDMLYEKLHTLVDQGATVIVVTHRIPEVMQHCDDVTVLRGGKLIASKPVSNTNPNELTELIVGHAIHVPEKIPAQPGDALLKVENLSVKGARGDEAIKKVSFELRAGEVTGLAGVDGNGQRELFHALLGTVPIMSGSIALANRDVTHMPTKGRLAAGLRIVPEDRHAEAVIENWSIEENAILGLQQLEPVKVGISVSHSAKRQIAEAVTTRFPTRFSHFSQSFSGLSGGNQQKVVTARAFQLNPKVILAFQPTRGIDINVSAQVFQGLTEIARSGCAVLLVSFDIDEILEHCDRILVINGGRIQEPEPHQAFDRNAIGSLMVGAHE